jgi:CheY-like chemotaxis protein
MSKLNDSKSLWPHYKAPKVADPPMLSAQTVLVVEEEFLIALDIQRMLEAREVGQTIFARSPAEAQAQHGHWSSLGLAIVEVRVASPEAIDLTRQLHAAGIPLVLSTGETALRRGLPDLPGVPVVLKPILEAELASAIDLALAQRR